MIKKTAGGPNLFMKNTRVKIIIWITASQGAKHIRFYLCKVLETGSVIVMVWKECFIKQIQTNLTLQESREYKINWDPNSLVSPRIPIITRDPAQWDLILSLCTANLPQKEMDTLILYFIVMGTNNTIGVLF